MPRNEEETITIFPYFCKYVVVVEFVYVLSESLHTFMTFSFVAVVVIIQCNRCKSVTVKFGI